MLTGFSHLSGDGETRRSQRSLEILMLRERQNGPIPESRARLDRWGADLRKKVRGEAEPRPRVWIVVFRAVYPMVGEFLTTGCLASADNRRSCGELWQITCDPGSDRSVYFRRCAFDAWEGWMRPNRVSG
jgi:hypothetical protein